MTDTLFVTWTATEAGLSAPDLSRLEKILAVLPGLRGGAVLTPAEPAGDHPFAADGRGPALVLQLDFASADARTTAISAAGALRPLCNPDALPSLAGARISHQPMTGRDFPVADPAVRLVPGALPCTFLVEYPGTADDLPTWLDHYDANHPPIMARFPGIRAVATFRPLESWDSGLPWERGAAMQRNKVVFDSADDLVAALGSPVMAEMRADAATFPPYRPRATHHAMDTRIIRPAP